MNMLKRIPERMDSFKEKEMNNQPQAQGSRSPLPVRMIIGSTLMLIALGFSLALYFWGHQPYQGGEQWSDVVATFFMVCFGVPIFVVGLVLFVIGAAKIGKRKAAQGDHR
jgi:hypothetical protein